MIVSESDNRVRPIPFFMAESELKLIYDKKAEYSKA